MKRIAIPVETTELCTYGCGQSAKFKNGSGKLMCSERHTQCPENRRRNSSGVKNAHASGQMNTTFGDNRDWRAGLFVADFSMNGFGSHKQVLIQERGHCCESCRNSEWIGKPITIELEHVDGNNKNNVRENLKLLCPNCHSQTPTWRRRKTVGNGRKNSDKEIIEAIVTSDSMNMCLTKLDLRWGSRDTIVAVMQQYGVKFMGG